MAPVLRTRSYMQVATTRQEHPIRLRRSEVEPGYLLCRLPGKVTAPEFGVCPHTRRGQPHRASGARPTTTQTRAPQPSPPPYETGRGPRLATRTVHLAGAGSHRHGLRTRMAPRRPSKTYREACARALQADAFGNMVSPDLRPSSWREVRPGFTPYLETKLKGREWYSNPSHLHSRRFECGISICFMLYVGAESMSVGEMNCPRRSQRPNAPLNSAAALAAFDVRHLLDRPRRSPLGTCG